MSPEERKLLEKNLELAEENNKMLRSMRRSQRISGIIRAIYWLLILGSAIGAYYYIQPYLDQIMGIYSGAKSNLDSVNNILENFKQ